jgi:hypothetical protein
MSGRWFAGKAGSARPDREILLRLRDYPGLIFVVLSRRRSTA